MEIIAFTIWRNRISPVFDVCRTLLVIEVDSGTEVRRFRVEVRSSTPAGRAADLALLGVTTLVCGAISFPYFSALESEGIKIIDFVSGKDDTIITDVLRHGYISSRYRMPGYTTGEKPAVQLFHGSK